MTTAVTAAVIVDWKRTPLSVNLRETVAVGLAMSFKNEDLIAVCQYIMPFGKYQGRVLVDLPEPYLLWFAGRGFPQGELGRLMALALILRTENLTHLVAPFRRGGMGSDE